MKIKSSSAKPTPKPSKDMSFPCVLQWAHNDSEPYPTDPYVTGKSELIVLFANQTYGVVLVDKGSLASHSIGDFSTFANANCSNWKPFVGRITLNIG